MDYGEKAEALFRSGYNCAQAVLCAFDDVTGLDHETALKISSSFGGGIGRLREVCGAVCGMSMAAGMLCGSTNPKDAAAKTAHYKLIQDLAKKYREANGSIVCRELLGLDATEGTHVPAARTKEYYQKRPCPALVHCAADILAETLNL